MKIIWRISLMKIILFATCWGLPIYEMQPRQLPNVKDTELTPIITSPCTPNGRCWGWLSTLRSGTNGPRDTDNYRLQDNLNISPFQRNINAEQDIPQWRGQSPLVDGIGTDVRSASPVIRQISNKPVKKDVFMSRSWGAGGMPFSVLYMNPHGGRSNHPPTPDTPKTSSESTKKSSDVSQPASKQPNNRVAVRNGTSQPRRQYSIIPQLFISYGWGPFGK